VIKLPPDITFVIQIVSFLVFWQLMRVLLFAPVQAALAARATRTTGARTRAETVEREAEKLAGEARAQLDAARASGLRETDVIRRQAEVDEQTTLGRYRDEAMALLDRERAITASQVEAARGPLVADGERLAERVVAKVLGRAA
jgi:F0F1-type ATP synthase membrane subunit b/b'